MFNGMGILAQSTARVMAAIPGSILRTCKTYQPKLGKDKDIEVAQVAVRGENGIAWDGKHLTDPSVIAEMLTYRAIVPVDVEGTTYKLTPEAQEAFKPAEVTHVA